MRYPIAPPRLSQKQANVNISFYSTSDFPKKLSGFILKHTRPDKPVIMKVKLGLAKKKFNQMNPIYPLIDHVGPLEFDASENAYPVTASLPSIGRSGQVFIAENL